MGPRFSSKSLEADQPIRTHVGRLLYITHILMDKGPARQGLFIVQPSSQWAFQNLTCPWASRKKKNLIVQAFTGVLIREPN